MSAREELKGLINKSLKRFDEIQPEIYLDSELEERAIELARANVTGAPTGYQSLDDVWRWVQGWFYMVSGLPGSGKTQLVLQLLLAQGLQGNKCAILSPEADNERHAVNLTKTLTGGTFDGEALKKVLDCMKFGAIENLPSVSQSFGFFEDMILDHGVKFCLLDPFNTFTNDDDRYINYQDLIPTLTKFKQFAKQKGVCLIVIEHPKTQRRDTNGNHPKELTPWDINYGQMFWNKADFFAILSKDIDPLSTLVGIRTWKVKDWELGFKPGSGGLHYKRAHFRYYENCEVADLVTHGGSSPFGNA